MRRTLPTLAALLGLSLLAVPLRADEEGAGPARGGLPPTLLVDELENGLQVVIEERHAVPIVRVLAYVRVGSLYEGEYLGSGLSHYMEHIVSGGSTRRRGVDEEGREVWVGRTEEENQQIEKALGGDTNASTTWDSTRYYITTKREMAGTAIDLIASYLQHCQFDPGEVAREQRVVQQELLRRADDPQVIRSLAFAATMFKVHPVRVPIVGYQDCIQQITRADMLRFYEKHYTPQNCVVAVVGDIDRHEALALVREHFGAWRRKPLEPYQIPQEPEQTAMRWVEREHGSTQTCLVTFGVPTIPLLHPDLFALDMLANVLGLGASSRLPRTFEHDPEREVVATGVATSSWTPAFGAGRFAVYFDADTVQNARDLVWQMWAEMTRLKEDLVEPEEIARALKVLEKYYHMGRATVDDRSVELASNQAWLHDALFSDTYLANIRRVTPEEIREAARRYLVPERLNVVIVTPPGTAGETSSQTAREDGGDVLKVVLDNGLTLLLKRVPGYGMVDVAAAFNGGVIYEDERTNGLFLLMANTFWRGTESRPLPALIQEMDDLGMDFEAESHNNLYYVKMRCLASELEPSMALFADMLRRPALEERWVELVKGILLGRVLPNLRVQADEILSREVREGLYATAPYRRQRYGTPETVASFTAEHVRDLHRTFMRPNNAVLALYGDIDPEAARAVVAEALGDWEPGEIPPSGAVEDPGPAASRTVEITNRQLRTDYRLAWRAYSRQEEEDRWATAVMSTIIGGSGWLHARLREGDADYVYSVYSSPYAGDRAGHFYIDTDFEPADEEAVLAIIDGVVEDVRAGRFTDEELALAKQMIQCYDVLGKKENPDVAAGDALSELYGQGWDYDRRYYEGVSRVTREDVIRVAEEIFSRPSLRVLVRPTPAPPPGDDAAQ